MKAKSGIYYVSSRPEAYEFWAEIGHTEARELAEIIARRAGERFPHIEFRIDDAWHEHQPEMASVATYIDGHVQQWRAEAGGVQTVA